jgi:hypothetical protein
LAASAATAAASVASPDSALGGRAGAKEAAAAASAGGEGRCRDISRHLRLNPNRLCTTARRGGIPPSAESAVVIYGPY